MRLTTALVVLAFSACLAGVQATTILADYENAIHGCRVKAVTYDAQAEAFLVLNSCVDFDTARVFEFSMESSYFPEVSAPDSYMSSNAVHSGNLGNTLDRADIMHMFSSTEEEHTYMVVNADANSHPGSSRFAHNPLSGNYPDIASKGSPCNVATDSGLISGYYFDDNIFVVAQNGYVLYGPEASFYTAAGSVDYADFTCQDLISGPGDFGTFTTLDYARGLVWATTDASVIGGPLDLDGCGTGCLDASISISGAPAVELDVITMSNGYIYVAPSWKAADTIDVDKTIYRVCAEYPGKPLGCDADTDTQTSVTIAGWKSKDHGIRGLVADDQAGVVYAFSMDSVARIPAIAFTADGGNASAVTITDFEPFIGARAPVPDIIFDAATGVASVVDRSSGNTHTTFFDLSGCGGEYEGATSGVEDACDACSAKPGCVWCGQPRGCVRGSELTGALTNKGDCPARLGKAGVDTCEDAQTLAEAQDAFWRWFWISVGSLTVGLGLFAYFKLNPPERKADLTPLLYGGMEKAPVGEMARKQQRNKLVPLERMLLAKDMQLVQAAMSGMNVTNLDEFAKATTFLFASQGEFLRLLRVFIKKELEKADSASGVFRSNSVASKLMGAYARLVGMRYLHATMGPLIKELMKQEGNLELDPNRISEADDEHVNKWTLMATCQRALNDIMASLPKMPTEFRILCHDLKVATTKRFPESNNTAVGGFLFLRFLCPAITAPDSFELVQGPVGESQRRLLVLVAKTLQNLSNGVEFGTKEVYMAKLNEFIQINLPKIRKFFDEVSTIPAGVNKNLPQAKLPAKVLEVSVIKAHRLIYSSRADIGAIMTNEGRTKLNEVLDELGEPLDENTSGAGAVRGADFTMNNIKSAVTGSPATPAPPGGRGSKRAANPEKRASTGSARTGGSKRNAPSKKGSQGSKGSKGSQAGKKAAPGGGARTGGSQGSKRGGGGGGSAGSKRGKK